MEPFTIFIGFVGLALLYFLVGRDRRPKNFPPGPRGVPVIGNVLQLGTRTHIPCMEMIQTYGNIQGYQFGSYISVVFHDIDDIKEVFNRTEFAGRGGYNALLDSNYGTWNIGVITSEGQIWQDTRRFTLKALRDHGFGRKSGTESIIQEEASDLVQEFRKKVGQPISTQSSFNAAVLNVIWCIISGNRFSHDDPKLAELLNLLLQFFRTAFSGMRLLNFMFPEAVILRQKFPFLFPKTNDVFKDKLFDLLGKTIQEHRETIQVGNPRDFIDTYLEEAMKNSNPAFKSNDDLGLIVLLMDFFIAGSETTSTTLTWALFLLAMNPQKQEKMYEEIKFIVGSRQVCLDDRPHLPYTEGVLTETMRVSSLIPMGVPHSTMQDVVYKGYNIPKNTLIFANIYAVHHSKETWGDPENFRPERFLSKDEKVFTRHPHIIPFSAGKRQCLGESLARDEFFIFLTNIVQQLKITFPPNEPKHSTAGIAGLAASPEPHQIILLDRHNK